MVFGGGGGISLNYMPCRQDSLLHTSNLLTCLLTKQTNPLLYRNSNRKHKMNVEGGTYNLEVTVSPTNSAGASKTQL